MAPSTFLLLLVPGVYLLADLHVFHGPVDRALVKWVEERQPEADEIAVVGGQSIKRNQVAEALRHRLFRRGLDWTLLDDVARSEHRRAVMLQLVDLSLLRAAVKGAGSSSRSAAVTEEMNDFVAEFDPRSEFARRLALQGQTEAELVAQIQARQEDLAWLESVSTEPLVSPPSPAVTVPKVWRVAHLFLSAHEAGKPDRSAEIAALHQQLAADPARFAELTAKHSEDERTKTRGGDLGWVSAQRMPEEFMTAVRAQPLRQLSQPVKTRLGWHLLLVTDHKPARPATEQETQPEFSALNRVQLREKKVAELLGRLRQEAAESYVIHAERLATVEPSGYSTERPPTPVGSPPPSS